MAENENYSYDVKILRLPDSATKNELCAILSIAISRIHVIHPKHGKTHGYIKNFPSEEAANKFTEEHKGKTMSNQQLEFTVIQQKKRKEPCPQIGKPPHTRKSHHFPAKPGDPGQKKKVLYCKHANKGLCFRPIGKCEYLHEDCDEFDSCTNASCLLAHSPLSGFSHHGKISRSNSLGNLQGINHDEIFPENPRPTFMSIMSATDEKRSKSPTKRSAKDCRYGVLCTKPECKFSHNGIVPLSPARINFLESEYGKEFLKKMKKNNMIMDTKIESGDLRFTLGSGVVKRNTFNFEQLLFESKVEVPICVDKCMEISTGGTVWRNFLKRYKIGFNLNQTEVKKRVRNRKGRRQNPTNVEESEDEDADSDSDAMSVCSIGSNVTAVGDGNRDKGAEFRLKLQSVTICSDSSESLSKAAKEMASYSFSRNIRLKPEQAKYILNEMKETRSSNAEPLFHQKVSFFINYFSRMVPRKKPLTYWVHVSCKKGTWIVDIKGLQNDVETALLKIRETLDTVIQLEDQIPISSVMMIFLQTKTSDILKRFEETMKIKVSFFSRRSKTPAGAKNEDDTHHCLKIGGSRADVAIGKSKLQDFLESLSECQRNFTCENLRISEILKRTLVEELENIRKSDDYQAVGAIQFNEVAESIKLKIKITLSVVAINDEALESIVEHFQNITDGHVVWEPDSHKYLEMRRILFGDKSSALEEFKKTWNIDIELDHDKSVVIIPAKSKSMADGVKNALLDLVMKSKQQRITIRVGIPAEIKHFVDKKLKDLLYETGDKLAVEYENNTKLRLTGTMENVNDFKTKIEMIIKNIQKQLVTDSIQLSVAEGDLLKSDAWMLLKAIERETNCAIRENRIKPLMPQQQMEDLDNLSSIITVTNDRRQLISVVKGNITKARSYSAIIKISNGTLEHSSEVAKMIADGANVAFHRECKTLVEKSQSISLKNGSAVKTTAGLLPFKSIIHAIVPTYEDGGQQQYGLLSDAILSGLEIAEKEEYGTVAIPAIIVKELGFPFPKCNHFIVYAIKRFYALKPASKLRKVALIDVDESVCQTFKHELSLDHRNTDTGTAENHTKDQATSLEIKWFRDEDGCEKLMNKENACVLENEFQLFVETGTARKFRISRCDKNKQLLIYSVYFDSNIYSDAIPKQEILAKRLVVGWQIKLGTDLKENLIRYPLIDTESKMPRERVNDTIDQYSPENTKPLTLWNIFGLKESEVSQAKNEIQRVIKAATISETFSLPLVQGMMYNKEELMKIGKEYDVDVSFQGSDPSKISMVLRGFKSNVADTKVQLLLYIQSTQFEQVGKDEDLKPNPDWRIQDENCKLIEINKTSPDYYSVECRMKETMPHVKIKRIERIQNKRLWEHYALRRRTLRNELNDQQDLVIEMELFHGTGKTPPNEIYDGEYGFDMTFCTSGMWGIGTYFAKRASYSCTGYAYQLGNGEKQVFLAHVLTGDVYHCQSDPSLRRPPKKNEMVSGRRYNSVSGETQGNTVYIVYENRVAYPTFLITFS